MTGQASSPPPATEADIHAERVAALFCQTPLAAAVAAANASLMTAILVLTEADRRAYAWLGTILLVSAVRLALALGWRRASGRRARSGRWWSLLGTGGAVAAGVAFGGGATWLWPASATSQLLWVFLVGGMCAGAAGLHHAHLPAALGFILPAGLPVMLRYALEGTVHGLAAAGMILVFLLALSVSAWRSSEAFGAGLRLRLDLARQAQALDAMNERLREEMDRHRATEESLRQAQKMEAVGQLTGGIAHDFNNLLTAVLGSLALLRKRLPAEDARAARLLDNALQGAQRGAALTQRLLAFGRRQTLNPTVVDLPSLVRGVHELLRSTLGAGIRLRLEFPPGLPPAYVDANQLELALLNLAANARDAMPGGGEVTISAASSAETGQLVLGVADTGEGMDEATLAQAMEPFFTTKGVGKGTGLGLAMVHGLAAQSGGRFLLRSAKGEGTVAELWLPAATASAPVATASPLPAGAAGPGLRATVLLVDDDALVLASTAAMLEDLGHHVLEAGSGEAALETLRAGAAVDLVITDYAMPGMNGVQVAEEVARLRPGLPVLLATGYAEVEGTPPDMPRLAKPFEEEGLARALGERLAAARVDTA